MMHSEEEWNFEPGAGFEGETRKFNLAMNYLKQETMKYLSEMLPDHQYLTQPRDSFAYAVVDRIKSTNENPEIASFTFNNFGNSLKGQSLVAVLKGARDQDQTITITKYFFGNVGDNSRKYIKDVAEKFAKRIKARLDTLGNE